MLPHDLIPVRSFVGLWQKQGVTGTNSIVKAPDLIDFGINPIPKFGARAINITYVMMKMGFFDWTITLCAFDLVTRI